jgi:hypothetical protein
MGFAVAVDGCELEDVIGGGSVEIKSNPSDKNFAEGKGIYFGTINISVSGSDGGGAITNGDGQGTGTLTGTGSSICDAGSGEPAVLVEDSAVVMVSGHAGQTPVGPIPVTVKVTDAGQDKVIAL